MSSPWECPRCHTINAPWIPSCSCKPPTYTVSSFSTSPLPDGKKCFCGNTIINNLPCDHIKTTTILR